MDEKSLIDPFGRSIDYLRLSLTDRCNLRCFYCLPKGAKGFQTPKEWLTFDEIEQVVSAFAELGVGRIRLTGGEPLVRPGVAQLTSRLSAIKGIDDLSLSTNATLLSEQASDLKQAGISRINVSLDTIDPSRFKKITGGELQPVLDGLMAAKSAGFQPVKINMVVMKGINDDEVEAMVAFCIQHDFTLRFIETMPMGESGRDASQYYLPLTEVKSRLAKHFQLVDALMPGGGPARYSRVKDTELRIGFITPISQHFCETCNRVRLAADGVLYLCMGQEHTYDLKPLLRDGGNDQQLRAAIIQALALKPERHEFNEKPQQVVRFMSRLGG